ncbi:MAG: Xaa-Pro peptidase family protein [Anaerolineae bacterium]
MSRELRITPHEYAQRRVRVRAELERRGLAALVQFGALRNFYLTGFAHSTTERPIALVLPVDGPVAALLPLLEEDHVRQHVPEIERLKVYPEYPDLRHPMLWLQELLTEMGLARKPLGVDSDGYGGTYGYRGSTLSALLPEARLEPMRDWLDSLRCIKSPAEIDLIRQCVPFGNLVVDMIRAAVRPGVNEIAVSLRAMADASAEALRQLGPEYRGYDNGSIPVRGGFVGGPKTALPHPIDDATPLAVGDVLIPWGSGQLGGYHSELERTMILGKPSDRQRYFFEHMLEAQQAALDAIRPGIPCSEVNDAVQRYFDAHSLQPYVRHHSGHGLGMEIHESPFLDSGDQTVIEPGMCFSCEPGLYVPGVGGFRHSETVVVTETGREILTTYPRDLESLIIPC